MNRIGGIQSAPQPEEFLKDVREGLKATNKTLPCKYFYDERGSQLFQQICELDEYYLTRTELGIMRQHAARMAGRLGSDCVLIEFGSGNSQKIRLLLDRMQRPVAYVPVDISREHLRQHAEQMAAAYPHVLVASLCADFTQPFELPALEQQPERTVVYFPGSTIGNFGPDEATALLARISRIIGEGGGLLIGLDLKKSAEILEPAYNDRLGITKQFNLNLLSRINRELGANFQLDRFRHHAFFHDAKSRIEMHLISESDQTVLLDGVEIQFKAGESIHTENSYKYSLDRFRDISDAAGLTVEQVWLDSDELFSVQYLTAGAGNG